MKKVFLTVLLAWVVGPSVAHAQTLSNEKITALEKKIEKSKAAYKAGVDAARQVADAEEPEGEGA